MSYSTRPKGRQQAHVDGKYASVSLVDPRSSQPFPLFVPKVSRPWQSDSRRESLKRQETH